jgi:hypothetical protein
MGQACKAAVSFPCEDCHRQSTAAALHELCMRDRFCPSPVLLAPPTSQPLPSLWLYSPYLASSTRASLSSLTARVLPRDVTASPTSLTPAATNAAMLSVVPPHTRQVGGRPVRCATSAVMGPTGVPGPTTARGSRCAKGCREGVRQGRCR